MCLANLVCENTDSVHRWLLCSVSASAWNSRRALFPTLRAEGVDGNLQSYNLDPAGCASSVCVRDSCYLFSVCEQRKHTNIQCFLFHKQAFYRWTDDEISSTIKGTVPPPLVIHSFIFILSLFLPLCLIFLYFVAFLCICGCFVDLCGSRWIIDFHEETNTRCLVFATYKTTRTWEGEVHSKITSTYFASGLQRCLSNTVVFDLLSFAKLTFLNYSESKWRLYP